MYPDLSYLLHDLIGTPYDNGFSIFKMYGILLAMAFVSALTVFKSELKRHADIKNFNPVPNPPITSSLKPKISKIFSYAYTFGLGYKLGYAIFNWVEFSADASGSLLSTAGNIWTGLLAMVIAFIAERIGRNKSEDTLIGPLFPHDYVLQITFIAAISGIIGAKLFSIVEEPSRFMADPMGMLFSGSGLTIYGGIIGGFIACTAYLIIKKIPVVRVWDSVAPALFVGYAVGRLGCHLAGDGDWGKPNPYPVPDWFVFPDWLWSYDYPHNILRRGEDMVDCAAKYCTHLLPPVYPTPIYEIIMSMGLFLILWSLRKKIKIPGLLFSIYLILNGTERFFIEFVRINKHYNLFGINLSQAQFIALGLIIIGIVASYYFTQKYNKSLNYK